MISFLISTLIPITFFFNTLTTNFERTVIENNKEEITKGVIYYQSEQKITVEIQYPVKQVLIFHKNKLELFYPDKNKVLILSSESSFPLAFLYNFLYALKEDFGLSEIGYKVKNHEFKNNIIYTNWVLSVNNSDKEENYYFIIGKEKEMIVSAESKNSKGQLLHKIEFKNHVKLDKKYFPSEIISVYNNESGKESTKEIVKFSEIEINKKIPDKIFNFKIPLDAKIEELHM
ncbi:MAG: DUF4292 domain-containing protein [Nitrospirae bacterium]|nr:DUF4292 domain-containing protein [Nitrospirota bacterium]